MPAKINLLNQKIGKLLVVEETSERRQKSVVWKCLCECGNYENFSTKQLRSEGVVQCKLCGVRRNPNNNLRENIIGNKYNHLTVLEASDKRSGGKILYKCQCDCEKNKIVYVSKTDLENGHTTSCGCAKRKYKIGDIINNRKIIDYGEKSTNGHYYYVCECQLCGQTYKALAQTLDKTISCGCQKSIGEYNIIQILQSNNINYIRQYQFKNSNFRYDFAIYNEQNVIIRLVEFDGEQHYENQIKNSGWNTYEKYNYTLKCDIEKNNLAKKNNIPLVRIPYWERDNITLETILENKYLIT